ncbi:hypothetical protein KY326_04735 [Candidatus Woesearchaeota archaeon]|nr:hypothetical protein [Candidatus Woesearchaeota archaeon]
MKTFSEVVNMKKIMFALLIIAMFLATTISATAYNSVDAAVPGSLAVGETKIFQVGAIDYEVSLRFVSGRSAKFQVNGEMTDLIAMGQWFQLADNSEIGVIDVEGNKVQFYIDPVGRVDNLESIRYPITTGQTGTFTLEGKQYTVLVKSIDRGGAVFEVNGQIAKLRNPKEAQNFYELHFPIDDRAMLSLWHIVRFNDKLYCDISIEPQLPEMPEPVMISKPTLGQPLVEDKLTYDKCVSNYLEKANYYRYRQDYPEAERIQREGLTVCGERFGKPIPIEPEPSDYDRCVRESIPSEAEFQEMSPERQVELKERIALKCKPYAEVVEVHPEYEQCRRELEEFKRMLVERYELDIPEELMRKYDEMNERCQILSGKWRTTRPMPEEVALPAIDIPEEDLSRPEDVRPKPMTSEFRRDCSGCVWEDNCLPIGTRLVK